MKQVEKDHYFNPKYMSFKRFVSFHHQLKLLMELNPSSILEIGVGVKLIKELLPDNFKYYSIDIDKSLKPDLVGDILSIPIKDNSLDVVAAFQVLEHLEFKHFKQILSEMRRISKKYVLVSLPYANHSIEFSIDLPAIPPKNFSIRIPKFYKKHEFDGQHYWELGKRGFTNSLIENEMQSVLKLVKSFTPFGNNYNKFYLLEKNG